MSSTDNTLNISTEQLAAAAGTANTTHIASAPAVIVSPPPGGKAVLDGVAAAMAAAIGAMITKSVAPDTAASAKQATALTEGPTVIVQQDHQGADTITAASSTIPEFPTLLVTPGASTGQVRTV